MLSEEEIRVMWDQSIRTDSPLMHVARAIERAVLERVAGVCSEIASRTFSSIEARAAVVSCHDAILALLPKEES